jgi:rSAM/selenodomain-associated transferase 2
MHLAIIIPVLDEGAIIAPALTRLKPLRTRGAEVIVVDGGSQDNTLERARPLVDRTLTAPRGRAAQMNAGAAAASQQAKSLLFLHADTTLPTDADRLIESALAGSPWGRFDVRIDGAARGLGMVAFMMNQRSRVTGICTGDQGIFMRRELFESLGGFAEIALMEDVEFSRRARRIARPAAIPSAVTTSGRHWEKRGVARTIVLMWELRLRYFLGADPRALARRYYSVR